MNKVIAYDYEYDYELMDIRLSILSHLLDMKFICILSNVSYDKYRNHRSGKSKLNYDDLYKIFKTTRSELYFLYEYI